MGNLLSLVRLSYDLEASHVRLSPELADNRAPSEVCEIDARGPSLKPTAFADSAPETRDEGVRPTNVGWNAVRCG
jgi:hypothetical protein